MATGPFLKSVRIPATGRAHYYSVAERYKTLPPHTEKAPYSRFILNSDNIYHNASANFDSLRNSWWLQSTGGDPYEATHNTAQTYARNSARNKFNTKNSERAAAGVALGEAKQSIGMVTQRITQLAKAAVALRKFRFYDAAEALGLLKRRKPRKARLKGTKLRWVKHPIEGKYYPSKPVTSKMRRSAHAFSALWLEYSFGWAPLVQDLGQAVKVLDEPLTYSTTMKVGGGYDLSYTREYTQPGTVYDVIYKNVVFAQHRCRACATLTVRNPNKDLAKRMGLADLGGIVLELTPFSFVANWFVNLDAYVRQFVEFYGMEVSQPFFTDFVKCTSKASVETRYKDGRPPVIVRGLNGRADSVKRYIGSLPSIKLGLRPAYSNSLGRALNQSSLLVQLFTSKTGKTWK